MKAGIGIANGVSTERGAEAGRLVPKNAVCVTLDWPLPPDMAEETILPGVVAALSQALATCGSVAFRYDDPLDGADSFYPPLAPSMRDRLLGIAGLGHDHVGIVVARDPAVITELFAYGGWSVARQCALAFDPNADAAPILQAVRHCEDWRGRVLPAGTRVLFGPGHDGDFGVLAAVSDEWLQRFTNELI